MWTMQSPKDFWELGTLLSSSKPQRNGTGSHSLQLSTQHGFIWTILNTSRRNYPWVKQIIEFKMIQNVEIEFEMVFSYIPKTTSWHHLHILHLGPGSSTSSSSLSQAFRSLGSWHDANWSRYVTSTKNIPSQPKNTKSDNETKKLRTTPKNWINRIQSASSIVVFSQCLPPQDSCSRR